MGLNSQVDATVQSPNRTHSEKSRPAAESKARTGLLVPVSDVENWLHRLYIEADSATLRLEDRRKAAEVAAMLEEIARMLARCSRKQQFTLVDAAAGKSYVGLLCAKLVLEPSDRKAAVITLEQDPQRVEASRRAVEILGSHIPICCLEARVEDAVHWPAEPSMVVALHACGGASDAIIDRSIVTRARTLLLAPCCTGKSVAAISRALTRAAEIGIPRHAAVRRRFAQAMVDAERTLRLEAAGYETEVVEFVAPTVTPHHLLWRARYVGEPRRMEAAQKQYHLLCH